MDKHVPVLLDKVLSTTKEILDQNNEMYIADLTLGQAGHSEELFKLINKGVLLSVDLDQSSIEWVSSNYGFNKVSGEYTLKKESKEWKLIKGNFSNIKELLSKSSIPHLNLLIADLGYSNLQLTSNLGISYDRPSQYLDMLYEKSTPSSLTCAQVLNTYTAKQLDYIFSYYGDIENPKEISIDIVNKRKIKPFMKVKDLLSIVSKNRYPKSYKSKAFYALRSFVNKELESLEDLLKAIPQVLCTNGVAMIITFNKKEEALIEQYFATDCKVYQPNITEIIKNPQSRSAKLYIYTKKEPIKA